jgi:hypothetical protein
MRTSRGASNLTYFGEMDEWPGHKPKASRILRSALTEGRPLARIHGKVSPQALDLIQLGEVAVNCANRRVSGLSRNLKYEAVGEIDR